MVLGDSVSPSDRGRFCLYLLLGCRKRKLINAKCWGERCCQAGREEKLLPLPHQALPGNPAAAPLHSPMGGGPFNRPDQSPGHFRGRSSAHLKRAGLAGPGARPAPPPPPSGWRRRPRVRGGSAGGAGRPVARGRAGGRKVAGSRAVAGAAAAVEHGRRRSTMRQPVDPG